MITHVLERYLLKYGGSSVCDNKYKMGTKAVEIDENSDIIVDGMMVPQDYGHWL